VSTPTYLSAVPGTAQAGAGLCFYRRVLVPVRANRTEFPCLRHNSRRGRQAAWQYVVWDHWTGSFKELTGGIWR